MFHILDRLDMMIWQWGGGKGQKPKSNAPGAKAKKEPTRWGTTDRPAEEVADLLLAVAGGKWSNN